MKSRIKNILILSAAFFLFVAATISFDALIPSAVRLPNHIKKIAVIDRSARERKIINILEGGITGEGIGQDESAAQRSIEGLIDQVNSNSDIELIPTNFRMKLETKPGNLPIAMPWALIKGICLEHNADAVLSLEFFDTDRMEEYIEAKLGFRLYDLKTKSIIDEYNLGQTAKINPQEPTVLNIINGSIFNNPIMQLSYDAGRSYGQRITPYWLRVNRKYYKKSKGDKDFAEGARMMEVNDWDAAIRSFKISILSSKRKTQGRSAHNLAVIHEILSDYTTAKEYSQLAWGKYENKASKKYSEILSHRIREVERLEEF